MNPVKPLNVKQKLASAKNVQLKYKKTCKDKDGKEWHLADPQATRALVALMDMYAVLGGSASHYGGPAAFAELMSATHAVMYDGAKAKNAEWYDLYNFVNDAGHCENGLYALKANYGFANLTLEDLKKFRSIDSVLTGHGESHLFPEAVMLSNGPLGSAISQAQGLSLADALCGKDRITITAISDGACMEGEAKEALAAIPGLASRGLLSPFVLIISDNNTKLSGRIDQESFSMQNTFESLKALGWDVLTVEKGNDLESCLNAVQEACKRTSTNTKKPVAIHAKTVKGIGTKKTAESSSGGHGFPCKSPSELKEFLSEIYLSEKYPEFMDAWIAELGGIEKSKSKSSSTDEKIQIGVSNAMIKAAKEGIPVVSVTSDLPGSTGVAGFRKEFPKLSFDIGVAESNMISVAAGFSKLGLVPVVDTFAQFGVTKGALPLTMASLSQAPMICIFSHTGFQDAADGASHQSLGYTAMLKSIPEVDLYNLTCRDEAEALVYQAIHKFKNDVEAGKTPRSSVFFLGRENFPRNYSTTDFRLGHSQILKQGYQDQKKTVSIFASGSMLQQALIAAENIKSMGYSALVVNPSILNRIDAEVSKEVLEKSDGLAIFVDDHQQLGSFAENYVLEFSKNGWLRKFECLTVQEHFGQSAYNSIELYRKHKLDSDSISKAALKLLVEAL